MQFYANKCNEEETLTPNPNECNSTLMSGTSGGAAPTYTIYTGEGGQLPDQGHCLRLGSPVTNLPEAATEEPGERG